MRSTRRRPSPDNRGGFVVTVAIADVAAYVRPGSALDREALERGNSVYFPDRVVPMLPERLERSLLAQAREDRPALAVRIVVDAGPQEAPRLPPGDDALGRKLSYQQAQAAVEGARTAPPARSSTDVLKPLWAAYAAGAGPRHARALSICPSARSS